METTTARANKAKLSLATKIGYGAGGYGAAMFFNNFCYYALFFFTEVVHMNVGFASMIISVGAIWDAITDPIVGHISDMRDPKKGRRRIFFIVAALPLAVLNWLAFTNPHLGDGATKAYFILIVLGAYLCQTLVDITYSSLGTEMTHDYAERSSLAAWRNVFWLLSIVISSYFLAIVDFSANTFGGGDMNTGYSLASLFCSIPIVITLFVAWVSTKGREDYSVKVEKRKFSWSYQVLEPLKVKPFRYVALIYLFSIVAQSFSNTVGLYFFTYCMGMSEVTTANFLVYAALIGYVSILIANYLSKRSKKLAWLVCEGAWAVAAVLSLFIMKPGTSIVMIAIFGFLYGTGLQTQYQLIWSRIPDCVELDEYRTGDRREGIFFGEAAMIQKIGAAITIAVGGALLGAIGYTDGTTELSQFTISGIRYIFAFGVAIPLILSFIINHLDPMTKERHEALEEALEARKAGKEYSEEGFKELL